MAPPPHQGRWHGPRKPTAAERQQAGSVSLRRIGRLFTPYRLSLAVVMAIIAVSAVVTLASPFLLRAVLDDALPHHDVRLLAALVLGMIGVAATTTAFGVVQTWISTKVGQHVMHDLRTAVFDHLQRLPLGFFTQTRTGEVQSRITNDVGGMENVVTSTATSIASNVTGTVATAAAMAALSWRLSLVSLVVMPPAVWTTRKVAAMRREITNAQQRELADLNVTVEEGLSVDGVHLAKTLGAGTALSQRFASSSARLIDLELRSSLAGRWRMGSLQIVFATIPALLYLSAGLPITSGSMTIGTIVAFTALQSSLFRPVTGLLSTSTSVISSLALFARIFEYLDLPIEIDDPVEPVTFQPSTVRGRLRFHDVTFRYAGAARDALRDVTIDVPAGSTLAVVGETGSGKTTLGSLVARLYDPTSGAVSIDGVDLRDVRLGDLASVVGVVSQDTYLLHASVRENLRFAKPDASDAEIEAAARAAQIHHVIAALPDGYDTVVGSRGHRFSGGEKQRIAIARTLLRDPRVLVLDEATSSLDNRTERAVQAAFDALAVGRTTVVIAHRLSTIRGADQIVVLEDGRVAERGTDQQLLADGGRYAELVAAAESPYAGIEKPADRYVEVGAPADPYGEVEPTEPTAALVS